MSHNNAGAYYPSPGEPPKRKSHKVRNSILAAVFLPPIGLVAGIVIAFALSPTPDGALEYSKPSPTIKSSKDQTITPPVPKKAAISDDGVWLVPSEVKPGTYRSTADHGCYWARLRSTDGDPSSSIIANGLGANQTVTVKATDKAFETRGCGGWVKVR